MTRNERKKVKVNREEEKGCGLGRKERGNVDVDITADDLAAAAKVAHLLSLFVCSYSLRAAFRKQTTTAKLFP